MTKEQSSCLGHESVEGYIDSKYRHQVLSKQYIRLSLIYLVVAIVSILVVDFEFPYVRVVARYIFFKLIPFFDLIF